MRAENPLLDVLHEQQADSRASVRDNAALRMNVALHEACHVVTAYQYAPWGQIVIPFGSPVRGHMKDAGLTPDEDAEVYFAGLVLDVIFFEHGAFALHDLIGGLRRLSQTYDQDIADAKEAALMERARLYVLRMLPNIQALAVEAMKRPILAYPDFWPAAKRAGLERRGRSSLGQDSYLQRFAQTPDDLCEQLGPDIINGWHDALLKHWLRTPSQFPDPCPRPGEDAAMIDTAPFREMLIARRR
jgi:hypothetical protein